MIISKCVDSQALDEYEIIDDFSSWIKYQDGSDLSFEQRKEVMGLLEKHPILKILCAAMYEQGYNSF